MVWTCHPESNMPAAPCQVSGVGGRVHAAARNWFLLITLQFTSQPAIQYHDTLPDPTASPVSESPMPDAFCATSGPPARRDASGAPSLPPAPQSHPAPSTTTGRRNTENATDRQPAAASVLPPPQRENTPPNRSGTGDEQVVQARSGMDVATGFSAAHPSVAPPPARNTAGSRGANKLLNRRSTSHEQVL